MGDVADKALVAAVNGADVKDAVIGTVFDNVTDGIIENRRRPEKKDPPEENPAEENENNPSTPQEGS